MPSSRPYTALNFKGDFVFRHGVIKPPLPDGVKFELFYTIYFQIGLANNRENVTQGRFCRCLSAFLFYQLSCFNVIFGACLKARKTERGLLPFVCVYSHFIRMAGHPYFPQLAPRQRLNRHSSVGRLSSQAVSCRR